MGILNYIYRVVIKHPLAALANLQAGRRRPQERQLVGDAFDFLYPDQQLPPKPVEEGRTHASNYPVGIRMTDGHLYIFPDGHVLRIQTTREER